MISATRRSAWLFWAPRLLSIAFIGFVSLFALDVFDDGRGWQDTAVALAVHLIPSLALAVVVALAWRRPWVGALLFGAAGALYVAWAMPRADLPLSTRLLWCATIAGPALLVAALFWMDWRTRRPTAS